MVKLSYTKLKYTAHTEHMNDHQVKILVRVHGKWIKNLFTIIEINLLEFYLARSNGVGCR